MVRWARQHAGPWEIPRETFTERVAELNKECDRVWVVGTSFGSEAALLCGARSELVTGVIAFAPSDVAWAGCDDQHRETSHWTGDGICLPNVPFDWNGDVRQAPPWFRPLYEQSRRTFAGRIAAASIPVERISRLLLVAGGDDQVWPSLTQAEIIASRRAAAGAPTQLVTLPDAGHRTILPGESSVTGGIAMRRGGSVAADRRLGQRAWAAVMELLDSERHNAALRGAGIG